MKQSGVVRARDAPSLRLDDLDEFRPHVQHMRGEEKERARGLAGLARHAARDSR